ncbi:MAG: helix-turn-helix domain-containing protein [Congregibacter sp.]
MPHAAMILYPEALATSLTLPAEILHAAGQMVAATRRGLSDAQTRFYATDAGESIQLTSGMRLQVDGSLDELTDCDLLVLPAIWRNPSRVTRRLPALRSLLHRMHAQGTAIVCVGTSSRFLAEAGLLDGKDATTHWHDFDRFEKAYPAVSLKRRHLITQSGQLYCVGSVNSIADFMVHYVSLTYGDRIARAIEAQFSPEARQAFETAAFLQQSPSAHHDALIREVQDHLQQHPGQPHTLEALAALSGLSTRSLTRRFKQATGETPLQYLANLRLRESQALLQHSDLSIAEVAWRCGYPSPSRFAQVFRRATDKSPRRFRELVRGKRFSDVNRIVTSA